MRTLAALSLTVLAAAAMPVYASASVERASLSVTLDDAPVFKHENTPENLKAFFQAIHEAMGANDTAKAAALSREVLPTPERLAKAFKDDAPADAKTKIDEMYAKLLEGAKADENAARVFSHKPEQTEIKVHAATTEQLIAKAEESKEFPGGAIRMAELLFKPGMKFYEVEYLEPGKDAGMKFHLFFWDGSKWCMAGPLWRAVREPATK